MMSSMPRSTIYAFAMLITALVLLVAASARRMSAAHDAALAVQSNLNQRLNDAAEIEYLRDQNERIAWRARPEGDLLARVNAVLAEAGIPSGKLTGVSGEADVAISQSRHATIASSGNTLRKQSMRIDLQEMTPIELGAFLSIWREGELLWKIEQIELSHSRSRLDADVDAYSVHLTAAVLYHDANASRPGNH